MKPITPLYLEKRFGSNFDEAELFMSNHGGINTDIMFSYMKKVVYQILEKQIPAPYFSRVLEHIFEEYEIFGEAAGVESNVELFENIFKGTQNET